MSRASWIRIAVGAFVGAGVGPWLFSGLQPARSLESPSWEVVAPALGVSAEHRDDRGTMLLGGALTLGSRDIRRPDRLSLKTPGEPEAEPKLAGVQPA